ncbi:hypothetical protein PIB30_081740 [Stylosanthes scabra]|uniref:Uncharacterized protein n=1 Tax=Stylosanthes scabra TaxID=79078 RepID=A0ABU6VTS9_9FABA|nr:hypothetical protein [Stylosanthes scabra]
MVYTNTYPFSYYTQLAKTPTDLGIGVPCRYTPHLFPGGRNHLLDLGLQGSRLPGVREFDSETQTSTENNELEIYVK